MPQPRGDSLSGSFHNLDERVALQPLRARRATDYDETIVISTSGITIKRRPYSVPSR